MNKIFNIETLYGVEGTVLIEGHGGGTYSEGFGGIECNRPEPKNFITRFDPMIY